MKRLFVFFALLSCAAAAGAQAAPAARRGSASLTVGGTASIFDTDYGYKLAGGGLYVDYRRTRWIQIEGEARWLTYNQTAGGLGSQSNYFVGLRVPIKRIGRFEPYGKVLGGLAHMNFPPGDYYSSGSFGTLAFGGGIDYRLTRRLSARADFEYQDWPKFIPNQSLHPWGVSVGVGYRIF